MHKGFTLIELLVVLVIMSLVLGLIAPKGSHMLREFQQTINKIKDEQKLSQTRSYAFIKAKPTDIKVLNINYHITSKGVILKNEKSNDNY